MWTQWRARALALPRPFLWLLGGMGMISASTSMVWPFLVLLAARQLAVPLGQIGLLVSLQAGTRLLGVALAGPLVDHWGRRPGLLLGLTGMSLAYLGLAWAQDLVTFAALLALNGLAAPCYRVAADAMTADLFPPDQRDQAFAWLRAATNAGIALGPAVGGLAASLLGPGLFLLSGGLLGGYTLLVLGTIPESRPQDLRPQTGVWQIGRLLRDRNLLAFLMAALPAWMGISVLWIFLSVYTVEEHGLSESAYGLLVSTNALLVTTLQVHVTRWSRRWPAQKAMAWGALLYAVSLASAVGSTQFWHFWLLMVVMTVGEMLLTPAASAWVANLAPPALRGRYMAVFSLMWSLSTGLVSPVSGWAYDALSPRAPWVLAALLALFSTVQLARLTPPTRDLRFGQS